MSDVHTISARRVSFDWAGTPIQWIPDDPQTTHTINVLHLLLPAGEKWFCDVYRRALPLVADEKLAKDVKGFIGQEAVHSRAHAAYLDHLGTNGLDTTGYTRFVEWLFGKLLADRPLGRIRLSKALDRQWLIGRLAAISAIEHFTCVLGNWILQAEALDAAGADPRMMDLLRWHGAEEVEHRSVAFDVYQHVSGSVWRRRMAMVGLVPVLAVMWLVGTRFFLRHDPNLTGERFLWRRFRQAGRKGRLPTLGELTRPIPRYMERTHHPSQEGSLQAAVDYLAVSPAAQAAGY